MVLGTTDDKIDSGRLLQRCYLALKTDVRKHT